MKEFDYREAVGELERIAREVENPETGVDRIDESLRRADELIAECRAWLRGLRDRAAGMEE